jgi:hypothetical protein
MRNHFLTIIADFSEKIAASVLGKRFSLLKISHFVRDDRLLILLSFRAPRRGIFLAIEIHRRSNCTTILPRGARSLHPSLSGALEVNQGATPKSKSKPIFVTMVADHGSGGMCEA